MLGYALALLVFAAVYIILYFERLKKPWRDLGVKSPTLFPGQSELNIFLYDRRKLLDKYYRRYKSDGLFVTHSFTGSSLFLCDLDLIKDITIKNLDHFSARGNVTNWFFKKTIFGEYGKNWKDVRQLMSKVFTSEKLKGMFDIVEEKGDNINIRLEKDMQTKKHIDLTEVTKCFTADVTTTCLFRLDSDCLKAGKGNLPIPELVERTKPRSVLKTIFNFLSFRAQMFLKKVGIHLRLVIYVDVLKMTLKTIRERKISGKRVGDFLDLLLEARKKSDKDHSKSNDELNIATQCTLFLMAGFDTVSNGLYYAIYYLAKYPEKQRILRKELEEKLLGDGKFNYENLLDCSYLHAAFYEALRLDSPFNTMTRRCTKDYENKEKNIFIKKDTEIFVELYSLHHDPDYWKDPEEYLPERFLPENKDDIVPYSFNPFGLGPRNCVAMRLAKMECKIALAKIFLNNEIRLLPGSEELTFERTYGFFVIFWRPELGKVKIVAEKIERN